VKLKRAYFRYLPVSDEGLAWGAYVRDAGYTRVPRNSPYPPYQHPADHHFTWEQGRVLHAYQFVFITRGGGVFESETSGTLPLKAGDLFVLFPGVWHRYRPDPRTGWDEYWIEFDGDYARRLMNRKAFSPKHPVLHVGYHHPLLQLFLDALDTLRREPADYQFLLGGFATQVIAQTLSSLKQESFEGRPVDEVIRKAKQLLTESAARRHDLEFLAAQLNLSYSSFRRLFKAQTGFSPRQFALQVSLGRAQDILSRTDLPIHSIADELGFESAYYFSKFFKQKTGLSPRAFRQRSRARLPHSRA